MIVNSRYLVQHVPRFSLFSRLGSLVDIILYYAKKTIKYFFASAYTDE